MFVNLKDNFENQKVAAYHTNAEVALNMPMPVMIFTSLIHFPSF